MNKLDWLNGCGEMGELIRTKDWSQTPLGPIETWPVSLRATVGLCLASSFPINIIWGPDHAQIYNDGYRDVIGAAHPRALGESFTVTWMSAKPAIGKTFEAALAGKTVSFKNQRMFLERNGFVEETFFTFSLSPIRDEHGVVVGVFHPLTETTQQMLLERRLDLIRSIFAKSSDARTIADAAEKISLTLVDDVNDIPTSFLYLLDDDQLMGTLYGKVGEDKHKRFSKKILLNKKSHHQDLVAIIRNKTSVINDKDQSIFPIVDSGTEKTIGLFVSCLSQSLPYDDHYKAFHELLVKTITTALTDAQSFQEETARTEKLALIDQEKIRFFSNVSHEFRTPLTLILGSIEEGLCDQKNPLNEGQRKNQELTQRNAQRLLKLVNTLLDFSRIEAGKADGHFQATDLPALTRDIASTFRSVIEHAKIRFEVVTPELGEFIYVDHDMWEKIVLNLLSNAYKFTFEGEIKVELSLEENYLMLSVTDTGLGIPRSELPHVFDRFHQIPQNKGRTHEGTGIGLSLINELVKIHGGKIEIRSVIGEGSCFRIFIPRGKAHLDALKFIPDASLVSTAISSDTYVHEALLWDKDDYLPPQLDPGLNSPKALILVVDDNHDLREYVGRVLEPHFRLSLAHDGGAALQSIAAEVPDLIVSDVMMPNMNGFDFLKHLRANLRTKSIPVIFLSARSGEEARIEGLNRGVNDYLEKPFSAQELIARIKSNLAFIKIRESLKKEMDQFFMQAPVPMALFEGKEFLVALANPEYEKLLGKKISGQKIHSAFTKPELEEILPILEDVFKTGIPFVGTSVPLQNRWTDVSYYPIRGILGVTKGVLAIIIDVTEKVESKRKTENKNRELIEERILRERFVAALSHDLISPLTSAKLGAEILAKKLDDPDQKLKVRAMLSNLSRVDNMVKNFLDVNQIKAGEAPVLLFEECEIGHLVSSTVADLITIYGNRFTIFTNQDLLVICDSSATKRILENLLSNAVKYGYSDHPISIFINRSESLALVEVHNLGNPIPLGEQQLIFNPYQRAEDALAGIQRGWGIGLGLVKTLVEAQGGSIGLTSTKTNGTIFNFTLPLSPNQQEQDTDV